MHVLVVLPVVDDARGYHASRRVQLRPGQGDTRQMPGYSMETRVYLLPMEARRDRGGGILMLNASRTHTDIGVAWTT